MSTSFMRVFVVAVLMLGISTAVVCGEVTRLHPPSLVLESLYAVHEVDALAALPAPVRSGTFALPNGGKSPGWKLAAPSAAWNATDAIVDPTLPGRRMIFAACDAALCLLHYERGGVAHMFYVMALQRDGDTWKSIWLASGHPAIGNLQALKALLENRSTLDYRDSADPDADY